MKKLLVTLLVGVLSFNIQAQDTIPVPQVELDEIVATLDTLLEQDSINNIIIVEQANQIENYKLLSQQDSIILSFKNQEIQLLNDQIDLHIKKYNANDKWYNKRPFGFVIGVVSTVGIIHILDYTLPE